MSDYIKLLPDSVANQIAAGEVVQRPASAVKELLENSIDAGANDIKLIIKDAGKTLIQVLDNGKGMSVTDARMSFERHATSKISNANDLFNLHTKGFRGEALASIAAIAQVEMKTKRDDDDLATCIKIEGSNVKSQEICSASKGTSISIKNLFFNIPARRNFLKSEKAETKHIIDEFVRVSLAHPELKFSLIHNSKSLYNLEISSLKKRIDSVFGSKSGNKFFPIEENTEIVSVKGFIGKPDYAKKSRGEQFFFVNNRFIKSPYLNHAVTSAFEGLLPKENYPSYFIYLDVDPQSIDINIHPTKTEIKFEDEQSIYAILKSCIKHSLGQYNIAPSLDFSLDGKLDEQLNKPSENFKMPAIEVDPNFNPFSDNNANDVFSTASSNNYGSSKNSSFTNNNNQYAKSNNAGWDTLYSGLEKLTPEDSFITSSANNINSENIYWERNKDIQSNFGTEKDFIEEENGVRYFQLQKKYIASNISSGLLLIDQNRAHERVLNDKLYNGINTDNFASQQSLFPIEVTINEGQWALLQQVMPDLENIGFDFQGYLDGVATLVGHPAEFTETESKSMLENIISDLENAEADVIDSKLRLLSLSFAKTKAVKYGVILKQVEMADIVNSLYKCENPNYSPTGKKISSIFSSEEIENRFS